MTPEVELAMKSIGIFVDNDTFYNEDSLQEALLLIPKDNIASRTGEILTLLKNLPKTCLNSELSVSQTTNEIFQKAIKSAEWDRGADQILIRIQGFASKIHRMFFKSFQEVFKKVPAININGDAEIHLDYLVLPFEISRTKFFRKQYEGCDIFMRTLDGSTMEMVFSGVSAILILVFYLKRVISCFLKSIKKQNSSEEESESDDDLPDIEKFGNISSTPKESFQKESLDDYLGDSSAVKDSVEMCMDCALINSSFDVISLTTSPKSFKLKVDCCSMLCLDYNDSLATFTKAFCAQLVVKNFLDKSKIENSKSNMKTLFGKVLDHLEHGRLRFFCQLLEGLEGLYCDDKDKIITIINEIAHLIVVKNRNDFEKEFSGKNGKLARKCLLRYMSETSNFLSLQAVVETMVIFFQKGIDICIFFPKNLNFLTHSFNSIPEDHNSLDYHRAISSITRKIIVECLNEKSIEVYELRKEEFRNEIIPSGRDPFLYLMKRENLLSHLVVFSTRQVYLERIKLDSITYNEEAGTLVTDHWKFTLKSKLSLSCNLKSALNVRSKINNISLEKVVMDDNEYVLKDVEDLLSDNDYQESDGSIKGVMDDDEYNFGENVFKDVKDHLSDDHYQGSDGSDDDEDETVNATLEAGFTVRRDDIKEYWDPSKHSGRLFVRETTGRDWPMMYSSPCAVVISYDHVKAVNSRKRNLSFARLTGNCIICGAKHKYEIEESPFKESLRPDGSISYEYARDMIVFVTVEGKFHVTNFAPNITKPFHPKEQAKGLHLRGEERRLLSMKASLEGAAPVYREGMAYLQKEQIESSNRTSVRSLPVIR